VHGLRARSSATRSGIVPEHWPRVCWTWTIGDDGLIAASFGAYDEADWDRQVSDGPES
jgi:hypothetical protein